MGAVAARLTARLEAALVRIGGRTVVAGLRQGFPLYLSRPFYLDADAPDLATVVLVHLGGGVLRGDDLGVEVAVGPGARARLAQQAATRVFRAGGVEGGAGGDGGNSGGSGSGNGGGTSPGQGRSRLAVRVSLAEAAYAEVWPEPLVVCRGAAHRQRLYVEMAEGAAAFGAELLVPGRWPSEDWSFRCLELETVVACTGAGSGAGSGTGSRAGAHFVDRALIEPALQPMATAGVMAGRRVVATAWGVAPRPNGQDLAAAVAEALDAVPGALAGASVLPSGRGFAARVLSYDVPAARAALAAALRVFRREVAGLAGPEERWS